MKKAAIDLALEYQEDISCLEIVEKIRDFKHAAISISPDNKFATHLDLLRTVHE